MRKASAVIDEGGVCYAKACATEAVLDKYDWLRKGIDLYASKKCYDAFCSGIRDVSLSAEQRERLLQKCAANDPSALFFAGSLYCWGNGGFHVDDEKAYDFYSRGAALGHAYCTHRLGICTANGWGVTADDQLSTQIYRDAGFLGCIESCKNAGSTYEAAEPPDYLTAARLFLRAADLGDSECEKRLRDLIHHHPLEACPWFPHWTPELHKLVPAWRSISRLVTRRVFEYILTRSEWVQSSLCAKLIPVEASP